MVEEKIFDEWPELEGLAEGSGTSEKLWLQSPDGTVRGLFKFPKYEDSTPWKITSEHISEWLAAQLGKLVGVACAEVELGYRNQRIGSFSHLLTGPEEALVEGVNFICEAYPQYDAEDMMNKADGTRYCLDFILRSTQDYIPTQEWVEMLMFDFLIGNSDRHQSNWALLRGADQMYRRCPLYDNGSSLCCYVPEEQLDSYFTKDQGRIKSLTDTKSLSQIRINGQEKRRPAHRAVLEYLFSNYQRIAKAISGRFCAQLTIGEIDSMLDQLPETMISTKRKRLISMFLNEKMKILASF